jgi:hypothetical protein
VRGALAGLVAAVALVVGPAGVWADGAGTTVAPAPAPPVAAAASAALPADGGVVSYRVEAVTRVPKGDLPVDAVFARTGAPRLTLVTCGGPFDYAHTGTPRTWWWSPARTHREGPAVRAQR